ncbi:hypothetical protein BJX99DRAFT_257515 [Aspergillus californicus]
MKPIFILKTFASLFAFGASLPSQHTGSEDGMIGTASGFWLCPADKPITAPVTHIAPDYVPTSVLTDIIHTISVLREIASVLMTIRLPAIPRTITILRVDIRRLNTTPRITIRVTTITQAIIRIRAIAVIPASIRRPAATHRQAPTTLRAARTPRVAHTLRAHTLRAHTLRAHTLRAHTPRAHTLRLARTRQPVHIRRAARVPRIVEVTPPRLAEAHLPALAKGQVAMPPIQAPQVGGRLLEIAETQVQAQEVARLLPDSLRTRMEFLET